MRCFSRVNKECRCSRAGECGSDLACDVAAFPHSRDHHSPRCLEYYSARSRERCGQTLAERAHSLTFERDGSLRRFYEKVIGVLGHV